MILTYKTIKKIIITKTLINEFFHKYHFVLKINLRAHQNIFV